MNIAVLPNNLARHSMAHANPRNAHTVGIYDIAGRLGQAHRRPAYLCRTIDALIAERDFPAPFPLLKGGELSTAAHTDSKWARAAVDAWFDNNLPPAARAAVDLAERVEVNSRLNRNLHNLFDEEVA